MRQIENLRKLAFGHANAHNHFNLDHHLTEHQTGKTARSAPRLRLKSFVKWA